MSRFVIMSHPRSATSWLRGFLSRQPDVYCYDELFNLTPTTRKHLKVIGVEPYENQDFGDWLESYFNAVSAWCGKPHLGFEVFLPQLAERNFHKLINSGLKVVWLWRENILQAAVSYRIAKKTGQWNHRQTDPFEPFTIEPEEVEAFIGRFVTPLRVSERAYKIQPCLRLTYERLFNIQSINGLLEFIEAQPIRSFNHDGSLKVNGPKRYEGIKNAKELQDRFRQHGYLFTNINNREITSASKHLD
jgi:hypothetical protein